MSNEYDEKFVDPRLVLYEELYQQVHRQIFDVTSNASGLGQLAFSTQSDVATTHPFYADIERAFLVTSNAEKPEVSAFKEQLEKLKSLLQDASKPNLLKANLMVAATCTILYNRIWNTIPIDLRTLPEVTEGIVEKMQAHESMLEHLLLE